MKVALVHDYIKEYGGAERVLEALHEIYPDAPVYTSVYLPEYLGPHRERFKNWKIKTSFLQYLPFKAKLISPMRCLSPLAFLSFDFSEYDVVIVSATGAYTPNFIWTKRKVTGQLHVCYCHTPPRYLYGYATARNWQRNPLTKAIGVLTSHFLRMIDNASARRVDRFIANSEEVKGRIKKFYKREAVVIYPPVDVLRKKYQVSSIKYQGKNDAQHTKYLLLNTEYYVAGGRLARPKHIDLIIRACRELDVPLKIFGKAFAGYGDELKELTYSYRHSGNPAVAGASRISSEERTFGQRSWTSQDDENTIEFLGEVTDEEKFMLMKNAKAYIFASEDEDFGITPVEAMMSGIPVIAYRSGGVKETVVDGKTGFFFDQLTVESLTAAIKECNNRMINSKDCIDRAMQFNQERFKREIREFIDTTRENS